MTLLTFILATLVEPLLLDNALSIHNQSPWFYKEGLVQTGETLDQLLTAQGLAAVEIHTLVSKAKPIFAARDLRPGKHWLTLNARDSSRPLLFVYAESRQNALVFQITPQPRVYRHRRPVQIEKISFSGQIDHSLAATLATTDLGNSLVHVLEECFSGSPNLHKLHAGDRISLIYSVARIGDEIVGLAGLSAAALVHRGRRYERFVIDGTMVDGQGEARLPAFLKSPIKNGRVSSVYARRRFHPVLKRYTPHLGTDFSAPRGTPIHALADGVVVQASYNRYNGHFIKIRHNATYTTQYLHMVRRAKFVKTGTRVRKGHVIGFVGNTGLAHGNHVCLRLWKNGRQVDFRKHRYSKSVKVRHHIERAEIEKRKRRLRELELTPGLNDD